MSVEIKLSLAAISVLLCLILYLQIENIMQRDKDLLGLREDIDELKDLIEATFESTQLMTDDEERRRAMTSIFNYKKENRRSYHLKLADDVLAGVKERDS